MKKITMMSLIAGIAFVALSSVHVLRLRSLVK